MQRKSVRWRGGGLKVSVSPPPEHSKLYIQKCCFILQTLEPPQYVFWYHNDKIITYDTRRTKVSFDSGRSFSGME